MPLAQSFHILGQQSHIPENRLSLFERYRTLADLVRDGRCQCERAARQSTIFVRFIHHWHAQGSGNDSLGPLEGR